ncbi:GNAT family N-acetyltransferase [Cocleimonas sp. KMM 6892]|uniref:GNAT family N-acetyltransferase n=1 Tax=unclassified Cocleimonas TaxID=2639732 RepID=UPI002DB89AD2|nr:MULTISPECIES: GNAT family N-acetyltransferase [unclassified Cocleimonas]MEB8434437.1 GNAT family N-acetyltransferase [Cocleimonas sp. KMM 6892]MEC4717330.1 GNAT family N-acetyltransferase [Cocleimonas sp. KMM 6895]MEC4746709.1 GNAT family N-acetyltransferase [Cocleimonas sp. KMM 6896]
MKFICYNNWNQLSSSSAALFTQAENHSLFFSRHWFENIVVSALDDKQKLLLACVIDENTDNESSVLAILPLITRENKEWTSLCHSYSALFSLLLAENQQQETLNCLCLGLKTLSFDYLTIQPVAEDDENIQKLQLTMESCGFSCHRRFRFYNWFHRTQGQSFTDYVAERPSKVRNTIVRKQRKLEREHGYEIRLHISDDIEKALTEYHDIYKVSWKANEQYEQIVQGFTHKASNSGWTRLAILYLDDHPVAAHLWYVVNRKASIFRLVYDQSWQQYSPGSILMAYLMEYVIDTDKVEEIDFLTGNERYKQDWMSERRERWELTFVKKPEDDSKTMANTKAKTKTKSEFKAKLLSTISRTIKKLCQ